MPRLVTLQDGTSFDLDSQSSADALIQHVCQHSQVSFIASRMQQAQELRRNDRDDPLLLLTQLYQDVFTLGLLASAPALSQLPRREVEPLIQHATKYVLEMSINAATATTADHDLVLLDTTLLWLRKHVHLVKGALSLDNGGLFRSLAHYMNGANPNNHNNNNNNNKVVINLLWVFVWTLKRQPEFAPAVIQLDATGFLGQAIRYMVAFRREIPQDLQQHLHQILEAMTKSPAIYGKLQVGTPTGDVLRTAVESDNHTKDHPIMTQLQRLVQLSDDGPESKPMPSEPAVTTNNHPHAKDIQQFLSQNHVPIAVHMILAQQLWKVPRHQLLVELDLSLTRKKDFQQPIVVGKIQDYIQGEKVPHWWPKPTDSSVKVNPVIRQRFRQGLAQQYNVLQQQPQKKHTNEATSGGLVLVRLASGQETIVSDVLPNDVYQGLVALVIRNDDTILLTKNIYRVEILELLRTDILPQLRETFGEQQQQALAEQERLKHVVPEGLPELED